MDSYPPGKLTTEEIDALLAGIASDELKNRVANSADYQKQVEEAQLVDDMLSNQLYRRDCPDSDSLVDHYLDLLSNEDKHNISQHLKQCPYCQQDQKELITIWEDDSEPEHDVQQQNSKIISIAEHPMYQVGEIRQASPVRKVRGQDSAELTEVLRIQITGHDIVLNIRVQTNGEKYILSVEVMADDDDWSHAMLYVEQSNQDIQSIPIDELGMGRMTVKAKTVSIRLVSQTGRYFVVQELNW